MTHQLTEQLPVAPSDADLTDIQGLVYRGYIGHPYAGFLFAKLGDAKASRAWLDTARRRVTPASLRPTQADSPQHIALSASGLTALGVPSEVLDGLPQEMAANMAARERVLGDDPQTWTLGKPASDPLDVLVMVYARDVATREQLLAAHHDALVAAGASVREPELSWRFAQREHFGFADGLSQPYIAGMHAQPLRGQLPIAAGEVVLGYANEYGKLPQAPRWGGFDLGKNGTYLVFRKLDQHVGALWTWVAARARELSPDDPMSATKLLGAKLMGRWPSGAPLALTPDHDDPKYAHRETNNKFGYLTTDPDGQRCPLSSHVRRANPRDARGGSANESNEVVARHRIVRRGRSYGPPIEIHDAIAGRDDGTGRGLYFIGLQASIARGFEFIQQTWLSNAGFLGGFDEADPITGPAGRHFTIPCSPLRLRLADLPRVVTTLGGGYFMLPSLGALARIAAG